MKDKCYLDTSNHDLIILNLQRRDRPNCKTHILCFVGHIAFILRKIIRRTG